MDDRYAAVAETLRTYFDGLYHSDSQRLAKVFHPHALYVTATEGAGEDGGPLVLTMDAYFPMVDQRPSPASRGEMRQDRIVSIEFAGPVTAFARVECAIAPKAFTDLLSLIFVNGRWQIIAKVFYYELSDDSCD